MMALEQGVEVIPTWNKSHREHLIVGTEPPSVREAADKAVQELKWSKPYYVDADHINLETVDGYVENKRLFHSRCSVCNWASCGILGGGQVAQFPSRASRHHPD